MRKLFACVVFLIGMATAFSQPQVGWNMVNSTLTIKSLADSNAILALIPEGGSFSWRDRYDKSDEDPADVVAVWKFLQKHNRSFSILFQAGDSITNDNIGAMKLYYDTGIQIDGAEWVNEPFYPAGGYSFDWSKYETGLIEFCELMAANFPYIPVSIPLAPRSTDVFTKENGGQPMHKVWNDAAFNFINSHPAYNLAVSIHIYFTGTHVPAMGAIKTDETGTGAKGTFPAKRVYNGFTDLIDEAYWSDIFYQADPAEIFDPQIEYIVSRTSVPIHISECGYIAAGELNGSWVFAAKIWQILCAYGQDSRIHTLNVHAGASRSRAGALSPRESFDLRNPENPYNVTTPTWDAMIMYQHMSGIVMPYENGLQINSPGTYNLTFCNTTGSFTPAVSVGSGLEITSLQVTGVSAKSLSSIGTSMANTKKGSVLDPDAVSGVVVSDHVNNICFGYVTVVISKVCVYGCMDPAATNYNADANCAGECIFAPPPPPPTPCIKKWWQFWVKCPKTKS